ncbi:MAG: methyltransferase type 12, partial [Verrucomicrobia bacterium]|nr:methyltransferase type 12 [Verrucomicrobiota bacterium]
MEEGKKSRRSLAQAPAKPLRQRVSFLPADALRLPKNLGTFDLLLAANLIDRLPHPKKFLSQVLPSLVNPGAKVLLTSPY